MPTEDQVQFERLKQAIFKQVGVDCKFYKDNYLKRRLAIRLRATGTLSYRAYLKFLQEHPDEFTQLADRLTINVTNFFRDPPLYEALDEKVIPELIKKKLVRVWSAGCSSGEEPYSLAMLLARNRRIDQYVTITATDIDDLCLAHARAGAYKGSAVAGAPDDLKQKYLDEESGLWTVKPVLKKMVNFVHHDLTGSMLPGPFDLIVCRNVMIYFNADLQLHLLKEFHRLLSPGGFLVLGKTEVLLGESRAMYRIIDLSERVYQRQDLPA